MLSVWPKKKDDNMSAYINDVVVEAYRKHLRRSPEPEGFAFWVNAVKELLNAGKTPSEVETTLANEFTKSPEYKTITSL
jgi:hypothetical protein